MLMAAATATMSAYNFVVDGIYYNINADTTSVSVTYKGSSSTGNTYSGQVTIPAEVSYNGMTYTVTSIGGDAFNKCTGLTRVDLPNTISSIGRNAFHGCTALNHINIPNSVTFIGGDAFMSCSSLTELFIPASVETIESMSFSYCYGLTSIVVDENNLYYDSRDNCNAIIGKANSELLAACVNTVIPNSVKRLAADAFNGFTWLTEVNLPDSLEYIGASAFRGCTGLSYIEIPNQVTEIADCAFAGCTGLTEVELPESLQYLGGCVFMDCPCLTSLFIPANVTRILGGLTTRDYNLTNIVVDPRNTKYDSRDNCNAIIEKKYLGRFTNLIEGCNNSFIPEGVTHIGSMAFAYCDKITEIEFPNSLINIDAGAFYECSALTSVYIPEGVRQIGLDAFRNCTNLISISLPSTMNNIGTFNIGTYCFYGCTNLEDVICFSLYPPRYEMYGFFESSTYSNARLHVPEEAIEAYKNASYWRNFITILPIGDINGDGSVAISDVTGLIDLLLSGEELPAWGDCNGDGKVTVADATTIIDKHMEMN